MRRIAIAAAMALLLQPLAGVRADPFINLVLEADTSCQPRGQVVLPPSTLVRGSIVATAYAGIQSARFRIQGFPAGQVIVNWSFGPGVAGGTGNPFGNGGSVFFTDCQMNSPITLYDVILFSPGGFSGVVTFGPDLNTTDTCPTVQNCDPAYVCAATGVASRPYEPVLLSPANGALEVPLDAHLLWYQSGPNQCACASLPWAIVYLGTDPDPPQAGFLSDMPPEFDPGLLGASTTYYWRVEYCYCTGCTSSAIASFRTLDTVAAPVKTWTLVKDAYR